MTPTHVYRWRKWRPEWFGRKCRVVARGRLNSVLVEFEDGERTVTSRFAVRKLKPESGGRTMPITVSKANQDAAAGAGLVYVQFEARAFDPASVKAMRGSKTKALGGPVPAAVARRLMDAFERVWDEAQAELAEGAGEGDTT